MFKSLSLKVVQERRLSRAASMKAANDKFPPVAQEVQPPAQQEVQHSPTTAAMPNSDTSGDGKKAVDDTDVSPSKANIFSSSLCVPSTWKLGYCVPCGGNSAVEQSDAPSSSSVSVPEEAETAEKKPLPHLASSPALLSASTGSERTALEQRMLAGQVGAVGEERPDSPCEQFLLAVRDNVTLKRLHLDRDAVRRMQLFLALYGPLTVFPSSPSPADNRGAATSTGDSPAVSRNLFTSSPVQESHTPHTTGGRFLGKKSNGKKEKNYSVAFQDFVRILSSSGQDDGTEKEGKKDEEEDDINPSVTLLRRYKQVGTVILFVCSAHEKRMRVSNLFIYVMYLWLFRWGSCLSQVCLQC